MMQSSMLGLLLIWFNDCPETSALDLKSAQKIFYQKSAVYWYLLQLDFKKVYFSVL